MVSRLSNAERRLGRGDCRSSRLPAGRQYLAQVVLVSHGWKSFEDVGEVGFRVVAVTAGALDECVKDCVALPCGFASDEEPILFSNGKSVSVSKSTPSRRR